MACTIGTSPNAPSNTARVSMESAWNYIMGNCFIQYQYGNC